MPTFRQLKLASLVSGTALALTSCGFGSLEPPTAASVEVMPAAYLSSHSLLTIHETELGAVLVSLSPDDDVCRWILDTGDTKCAPSRLSGIDASTGITADANIAWHVDFGSGRVSTTDFATADSKTFKSEHSPFQVLPDGESFLGSRSGAGLVVVDAASKKTQRSVPGLPRYGRNEVDTEGNIWTTDQDSVWFTSADKINTRRIDTPLEDIDYTVAGTNPATQLAILAANPVYSVQKFWVVDVEAAVLIPSHGPPTGANATFLGAGIAPEGNFVVSLWAVENGLREIELHLFGADLDLKDALIGPARRLANLSSDGVVIDRHNFFRISDDGQLTLLAADTNGSPIVVVVSLD